MDNELTSKKILKTYIIFFIIWVIRLLLLKSYIDTNYSLWAKEILNGIIKSIIWLGFAHFYIKKYSSRLFLTKQQMLRNPIRLRLLLLPAGAICLYFLFLMLILHRGIYLNPDFHPSMLIGSFFLAGFLEESVFRGCFLNGLLMVTSGRKANTIAAVGFLIIHYPSYIIGGTPAMILYNSIGIFIAGLIFGWSYKKNKSLWAPVILHMLWNLLSITVI